MSIERNTHFATPNDRNTLSCPASEVRDTLPSRERRVDLVCAMSVPATGMDLLPSAHSNLPVEDA
jgi:hypothetical protein